MADHSQHSRFHGRVHGNGRACAVDGCGASGEFRAPGTRASGFDGPGDYRWLCLDHVRAFNATYNYFEGMTEDEILHAQTPHAGWANAARAFSASPDQPPRWADFHDPLDAISARFRAGLPKARKDGKPLSAADHNALRTLGLDIDATLRDVRTRYSALVRQYHPDRNGGDRSMERKLQAVTEAYRMLRASAAFA